MTDESVWRMFWRDYPGSAIGCLLGVGLWLCAMAFMKWAFGVKR